MSDNFGYFVQPDSVEWDDISVQLDTLLKADGDPTIGGLLADDELLRAIAQELQQGGFGAEEECRIVDVTEYTTPQHHTKPMSQIWSPVSTASFPSFGGECSSSSNSSDDTKLCHVCGNEAGRHNYYGGQACNSCRAFFRRTVQTGRNHNFRLCDKGGNCPIDSKSWRSCQSCRFQKCLSCGMNVSWVLSEAERTARKRTAAELPVLVRAPSDLFTLEDEIYVRGYMAAIMDFAHRESAKFYSKNIKMLEKILVAAYHGQVIPLSLHTQVLRFMTFKLTDFFGNTGDMEHISKRDQIRLVNRNFPISHSFFETIILDSEAETEKYSNLYFAKLKELAEEHSYLRVVEDKLNEISLDKTLKMPSTRYEQLYPANWAKESSAEARHRDLTSEVRHWSRKEKSGVADEIQSMLVSMIILFSTDFVDLDNPRAVEVVQLKYAKMLSRYLKSKYKSGGCGARLCKAMYVCSMSRELAEIKEKHCQT